MRKIYVIGHDTAYKIGFSADPESRVKELQTGNDKIITLLFEMERKDANFLEKHLHRKFRKHRLSGEWFSNQNLTLQEIIVAIYGYTDYDWS